jgi:hypothetical protein
MGRSSSVLLLAVLLFLSHATHGKDIVTSTCAIQDNPQAFKGAVVVLKVILEPTAHNIVLYEEKCPLSHLSWDFLSDDPDDPSLQRLIKETYRADNHNIHHPDAPTRAVVAQVTGKIILLSPYPGEPLAPYILPERAQIFGVRPVRLWSDFLSAEFRKWEKEK